MEFGWLPLQQLSCPFMLNLIDILYDKMESMQIGVEEKKKSPIA